MSAPSGATLSDSDTLLGSRTSTDQGNLYSSPKCIFFAICIAIMLLALNVCVFGAIFHNIKRMPSVDVSSAMVSPFTISYSSQHQLTAIWKLSMEFPNTYIMMELTYQRIDASLFYGPHLLSQATIPPFHLQKLRTAMVNLTMAAQSEPIDGDASSGMVTDLVLHGSIDFRLELQAWVIFDGLRKGEALEVFRVRCDGVKIAFNLSADGVVVPGAFLHPPLKCRVLQGLFDKFH